MEVIFIYQKEKLLECQKEFLFNSIYEATEWSFEQKILRYICNKSKTSIYCDIPDDINFNLSITIFFH